MRDLLLFALAFGGLPFILRWPWIGILYWVWLSLMNPHRLTWGYAYDFPFAQLIAITTFIGFVLTSDPRQFKGGAAATTLLAFVLWTVLTTLFALEPEQAKAMLERVLKIQVLTFMALLLLHKRQHVLWFVGAVTVSVGFFGVKGGVFTLSTLGSYRVWGPPESFIADNNALALATVMTIPLWIYFFILFRDRWWRWGLLAAAGLSAASALGSQSRGALVAIAAMTVYLWLKGRHKLVTGAGLAMAAILLVSFMPSTWDDRMKTIGQYEQDDSAVGRIETWKMMFDIAIDRPLVAGGFEPYSQRTLARYRPQYSVVRAAHSIYFQVLGEQGFIGFGLLAMFWVLTWRMARWIIRTTKDHLEDRWAFWLARMIQVSLVAYFVGGAFLNLAYWDMPYYLMVALAVTKYVLETERRAVASVTPIQVATASGAAPVLPPAVRAE